MIVLPGCDGGADDSSSLPERVKRALGRFTSPYFVLGRQRGSTYTYVRLAALAPSGLVWLATRPSAGRADLLRHTSFSVASAAQRTPTYASPRWLPRASSGSQLGPVPRRGGQRPALTAGRPTARGRSRREAPRCGAPRLEAPRRGG